MSKLTRPKIFIDGEAGTTGLEIKNRLKALPVDVLSIASEFRKDEHARKEHYTQADLVVLCLPDEASREAITLWQGLKAEGSSVPRILDASSAFRTHPDWVYGFAELSENQAKYIAQAPLVANPGCYATGVIALLAPLVKNGLIPADFPLHINAISGYSGGGKTMIADHQHNHGPDFELYALQLNHKHIPEIMHYSGLTRKPVFVPSVGHFLKGMIVSIPLHLDTLSAHPSLENLSTLFSNIYNHPHNPHHYVRVCPSTSRLNVDVSHLADAMEIHVHGNENQAVLTAKLDNLGKGAAGAAVQNISLMLDLEQVPAFS
ncbi:N-acetyl-gamma-glutamyl-phosphate reductase [Entomobacter blattae]|uniref:N-acetyl-gamma-glutamyl-phosphate reductase n=1 Tax=Entomobacter blattae TaxID=2762277 RepID=A0A7H1NT94_9PROT|nr:N-acetyl-gamma-glutamyl-phosphate reductase [Entomobacter blattae]QNT79004.1 N-acetyl-gamma-glutamyl-phosphate reductase [Entomobacter blattae]